MIVYAVFQQGVYRHDCGGVFDTREQAEAAARRYLETERDNYHHYAVVPFTVNVEGVEPDAVSLWEKTTTGEIRLMPQ